MDLPKAIELLQPSKTEGPDTKGKTDLSFRFRCGPRFCFLGCQPLLLLYSVFVRLTGQVVGSNAFAHVVYRFGTCTTPHCIATLLISPCWKLAYTCLYCGLATIILGNLLPFGSGRITLVSFIFRRGKDFIIRQNVSSSGSMCRCILLDKIVHDKHNNKLHWTRVEQTIMHNYAQLCTILQFGPIVNDAQLCTIMHLHNPPLLYLRQIRVILYLGKCGYKKNGPVVSVVLRENREFLGCRLCKASKKTGKLTKNNQNQWPTSGRIGYINLAV